MLLAAYVAGQARGNKTERSRQTGEVRRMMTKAQWEMTAEEQRILRAQIYELREVINCLADNFDRRALLPEEDVAIVQLMSAGCRQGMAERAEKAMQQLAQESAAARPKLVLMKGGKILRDPQ